MAFSLRAAWALAATALLVGSVRPAPAAPPAPTRAKMRPEVADIIQKATAAYRAMRSYQHTARWNVAGKTSQGPFDTTFVYTLALERPQRFAYRLNDQGIAPPVAAVCDGKTFTNFKGDRGQFTRVKAPAAYTGINIVDDVEFQPIATYVVALMLQGDPRADKDVRAALAKATLRPTTIIENGRTWQILDMTLGTETDPYEIWFGADDHLIGKAVRRGDIRETETLENIQINKPVDAAAFQFTPPAGAKHVEQFTAPQRPGDA